MTRGVETSSAARRPERRVVRSLVALLPPLLAVGLQLWAWPLFRPSVWFLFYPAVFFSSWIGGLRTGIVASLFCAAAGIWFFVSPGHSFAIAGGQYLAALVFVTTGIVFGVFHDRLRRANERTARSLLTSERANLALKKAVEEREIFEALVANSSDFIGIADPDGNPVYVNPAGRRMVGLAPDAPIESTKILDYYTADQRSFASDVIVKSMVERGHWQGETSFRNWQTDKPIPVSDTHFTVREPATGELLGLATITRDITELKQARDALEQASQDLQKANAAIASLLEQAPDGIFVADLDGRYVDVNDAGCRLLGRAREEIIGKTILDLIPKERIGQLEHEKELLLDGQDVVSEWALLKKDGSWLSVEVSAKILSDGRWQGFVRDISERKALESALRAAHGDLLRAQSVAEMGSWRLDARSGALLWSDEACRIFGVAPGTPMTREAFLARVHPADRADVEREWAAALAGKPYDVEHRIIADGEVRWVREKADLEFDDRHTLVGGLGVTVHITQKKRLENEQRLLSEAGNILASTLELEATLTSIGRLATRDLADFCIIYVTEKGGEVRRLKVVSRDQERDSLCTALTQLPMDRTSAREIWSELEANRSVHLAHLSPEWALTFARSDEHRQVLRELDPKSIIMAPLSSHGKLLGAMALISTAADRTYSAADVRFAEQIAQGAAYAIDNAQLYAAAQRAIQARDKVLAVVAHDLRNPLGAMILHATLLRRAGHDSEAQSKKSAESIERTGRRMDRIIQDLLDVNRMQEGHLPVDRTRTSARQAICDCVEAHAPLAAAASLHLEVQMKDDLPELWADRHRLLQILENLIGNAMKFTEKGGTVSIGAAPKEGEVLFWVRDTGPGIAPEAVTHVFDRFWQAKRDRRGLGLGLAIVKGLVEAHGGRIWIESHLGQGTTIFFTIPSASAIDASGKNQEQGLSGGLPVA